MSKGTFNNFLYTRIKELKDQYNGIDEINRYRRSILNDLNPFYQNLAKKHVDKIPDIVESLKPLCNSKDNRLLAVFEIQKVFHNQMISDRTASKMNSSDVNLILSSIVIDNNPSFFENLIIFLQSKYPSIQEKCIVIEEIKEKVKILEKKQFENMFALYDVMTNAEFEMYAYHD